MASDDATARTVDGSLGSDPDAPTRVRPCRMSSPRHIGGVSSGDAGGVGWQEAWAASGSAVLVAEVAQLARERDELARRVAVLDAKLIEVTDRTRESEAVRAAYRRGYFAGRASQRRGAAAVADPERHARGWVREVLTA